MPHKNDFINNDFSFTHTIYVVGRLKPSEKGITSLTEFYLYRKADPNSDDNMIFGRRGPTRLHNVSNGMFVTLF